MPVYEYQCKQCGKEFEYQQRMADPDKTVCESCGGALERLISRTAFQLKGSGWYKDLYSSAKPGGDAKPAESATTTTESKPATEAKPATESKPAATESKPAAAPAAPSTPSGGSSGGTGGGTSGAA